MQCIELESSWAAPLVSRAMLNARARTLPYILLKSDEKKRLLAIYTANHKPCLLKLPKWNEAIYLIFQLEFQVFLT